MTFWTQIFFKLNKIFVISDLATLPVTSTYTNYETSIAGTSTITRTVTSTVTDPVQSFTSPGSNTMTVSSLDTGATK